MVPIDTEGHSRWLEPKNGTLVLPLRRALCFFPKLSFFTNSRQFVFWPFCRRSIFDVIHVIHVIVNPLIIPGTRNMTDWIPWTGSGRFFPFILQFFLKHRVLKLKGLSLRTRLLEQSSISFVQRSQFMPMRFVQMVLFTWGLFFFTIHSFNHSTKYEVTKPSAM